MKASLKGHIMYEFIDMIFWKRKTTEIIKRSMAARVWRKKARVKLVKQKGFFRMVKLFCMIL